MRAASGRIGGVRSTVMVRLAEAVSPNAPIARAVTTTALLSNTSPSGSVTAYGAVSSTTVTDPTENSTLATVSDGVALATIDVAATAPAFGAVSATVSGRLLTIN